MRFLSVFLLACGLVVVCGSDKTRPYAVRWSGYIQDPCGYGDEARQFILGLSELGVKVAGTPLFDENTKVVLRKEDNALLKSLIAPRNMLLQKPNFPDPVINVMHIFPPHFRRLKEGHYHIGRTMFETENLPPAWIDKLNMMDEVWVPSSFNARTFAAAGVDASKIVVMPEGINIADYKPLGDKWTIPGARKFNFLSMFDWHLRKGWDVLLRAFVELFPEDGAGENVALIFKVWATNHLSMAGIKKQVEKELQALGRPAVIPSNIVFYEEHLSAEDLNKLYRTVDAYVLPTRGEGWGRPFMESMLMGLPTIATRYSGQVEFMNDQNSFLVNCTIAEVEAAAAAEVSYFRGHSWCHPHLDHLKSQMQFVFEHSEEARLVGQEARKHIMKEFNRATVARKARARFVNIVRDLGEVQRHPEL